MSILLDHDNNHSRSAGSSGRNEVMRHLSFHAMGTECTIWYVAPSVALGDRYETNVRQWVEVYEARYSRFCPTSLVSRINGAAGSSWVEIDEEMEQMLDICETLHDMSDGVIDATMGPLIRLWDYRHPVTELPDPSKISEARELVGWSKMQRASGRVFLPKAGMSLDFGGWGKEWAVDAAAQLAISFGLTQVLVDFGHDIRCVGAPPGRPAWHVGLENPARPGTIYGSIALFAGKGIASSGDYLRGFNHNGRRYGHIVDPRTGEPVAHDCRQVTIIADSCFQAGILSTTAFVLGPVAGLEFIHRFPGAEGLIITHSSRVQTRGFWNYVAT